MKIDKPHKKLDAWKKAIAITVHVYKLTEKFPEAEKFGLVAQMRRAAVSIASNIAEGAARNTKKEFIYFLFNAQGSLSEIDTQIVICKELKYLSNEDCTSLDYEMELEGKLIAGLIKHLRR